MARPATTPDFSLEVHPHTAAEVDALDLRVRRLEDAVAALQDTQLMEDRVVERLRHRAEFLDGPRPTGLIVNAARMLLPKTVEDIPVTAATVEGNPTANGSADGAHANEPHRPGWLLVELFGELRAMARMFADYRYRMSWTGRVVPLAALVIAIVSWLLVSGIPFVGGMLDRATDLVLIVVVYKAMIREVQRYRELIARVYRYR